VKKVTLILLILAVFYSRFVGLTWGLPYPFHPDERNMANALQSLTCTLHPLSSTFQPTLYPLLSTFKDCFNPHFFAYGQLPLYIGYILIQLSSIFIHGSFVKEISFTSAVLSLRLISAISTIASIYVLYRLLRDYFSDIFEKNLLIYIIPFFIFAPFLIQFGHFGTTESTLILLYLLVNYVCLSVLKKNIVTKKSLIGTGIIIGIAVGIKISSLSFGLLPLVTILFVSFFNKQKIWKKLLGIVLQTFLFSLVLLTASIITSPQNVISFSEFLGSIVYESSIARGTIAVFYTRQFLFSSPFIYQLKYIFPYALGIGSFVLFLLSFFLLSYKDKRINLLRFSFLLYFIPASLIFAKWSRFMAPLLPIALIFVTLSIGRILKLTDKMILKKSVLIALIILLSIPGIAYLSIYLNKDVRESASEWIYKNIPDNARILSETANVVDIPLFISNTIFSNKRFEVASFDFYNIDTSKELQDALVSNVKTADYIFIPSKRIFASHTCFLKTIPDFGYSIDRCKKLRALYPVVNEYYDKIENGELGFKLVQTITSYPSITIFGKTLLELNDEGADETWTVFDHPVIRIYKKI